MSESDKDKFAELDKSLQWESGIVKNHIDNEKAYFAKHMLELEQLVRWWNIKMDEFNYGRQKLRIKEDYNRKKTGWVVYLFEPPTFGKGLLFQLSLERNVHFRFSPPRKHHGGLTQHHDAVITKMFLNKKLKLKEKNEHFKKFDSLKELMTKLIASSPNHQDAIKNKPEYVEEATKSIENFKESLKKAREKFKPEREREEMSGVPCGPK